MNYSKNFDKIKYAWDNKQFNQLQIYRQAYYGNITKEEYEKITGEKYKDLGY